MNSKTREEKALEAKVTESRGMKRNDVFNKLFGMFCTLRNKVGRTEDRLLNILYASLMNLIILPYVNEDPQENFEGEIHDQVYTFKRTRLLETG